MLVFFTFGAANVRGVSHRTGWWIQMIRWGEGWSMRTAQIRKMDMDQQARSVVWRCWCLWWHFVESFLRLPGHSTKLLRDGPSQPTGTKPLLVCILFVLWTLRKKTPSKKGFWWLTEFKLKIQSLAAISTWEPLTQTTLQGEACTELPTCAVFLQLSQLF